MGYLINYNNFTMAILFLLFIVTVASVSSNPSSDRELFKLFITTVEKYDQKSDLLSSTGNRAFKKEHFKAFKKSKETVDAINQDSSTPYSAELNRFSFLTAAERSLYLGFNSTLLNSTPPEYPPEPNPTPRLLSNTLPGAVDWSKSAQNAIRLQGECSSCWAFSAVSTVEFGYMAATGDLIEFSDQEMLECGFKCDADGRQMDGCEGGYHYKGIVYVKEGNRLASLEDMPYQGRYPGSCTADNYKNSLTKAKLDNFLFVRGDENVLGSVSKGVVAAGIGVSDKMYLYESGVYANDGSCASYGMNHAVNIVGYGVMEGRKYWKVRNSWGRRWGDAGHLNLDREQRNMCNITKQCVSVSFKCTGKCNPPEFNDDGSRKEGNGRDDKKSNDDKDKNDKREETNCKDKDFSGKPVTWNCGRWKRLGICKEDAFKPFLRINCPKTCFDCL